MKVIGRIRSIVFLWESGGSPPPVLDALVIRADEELMIVKTVCRVLDID